MKNENLKPDEIIESLAEEEIVKSDEVNIELLKILITDRIMPKEFRQNTEVTKNERTLLSLGEAYAEYIEKFDELSGSVIKLMIKLYAEYGIALKRKGRKEALAGIKALNTREKVEEEKEKSLREALLS